MGHVRTVHASIGNPDDHLPQDRWADYHRKFVVLIRRAAMIVHAEWVSPSNARVQSACVAFEIGEGDVAELKHDLRSLAGEYGHGTDGWTITWADAKTKHLTPETA